MVLHGVSVRCFSWQRQQVLFRGSFLKRRGYWRKPSISIDVSEPSSGNAQITHHEFASVSSTALENFPSPPIPMDNYVLLISKRGFEQNTGCSTGFETLILPLETGTGPKRWFETEMQPTLV